MAYASKQIGIQNLDDWYSVSNQHIFALGGYGFIDAYGGLINGLRKYYPNHSWDINIKLVSSSKGQNFLFKLVKEVVPAEDIQVI